MATKKPTQAPQATESPVIAFLSGRGPNPRADRREGPGPLETEFLRGVDEHIAAQDAENNASADPSATDDLMAVIRLIADNKEMIAKIKSGKCDSVSDLAKHLGRELSNVSRTLSKMAAYGLVGFERDEDSRSKKPVWLLPIGAPDSGADWIELFCLARAMKSGGLDQFDSTAFEKLEGAVRIAVDAASAAFDEVARPIVASRRSKGTTA